MGLAAQYILHDPLELALPIPHGKYDVPLILKDACSSRRRPGHRRQQRDRHLRRRRPRQRRAVAEDGGRAAQVPLPHPQRLGLALLRPLARHRRAADGHRHRRRAHARTRSRARTAKTAWPSATRSSSTSRSTRRASASCCRTLSPKNNIDFDTTGSHGASTSATHVSDPRNNEIPQRPQPEHATSWASQASDAVGTRDIRFERENGELDDQRRRRGRTSSTATTSVTVANPALGRRRDLGAREPVRRLVPPGPHPPRRLQGPRPQRQGRRSPTSWAPRTSSTSARTRRSA